MSDELWMYKGSGGGGRPAAGGGVVWR
jgi:hypothetical protein